ncbi:MAG: hypothetical protein AAF547_15440 [Actinomycetota bacterium]
MDDQRPVELLEDDRGSFLLGPDPDRGDGSASTSESVASPAMSKLVGFGAVAVVLLAIAIMSRPGDSDPIDQLSPAQQQEIRDRQNARAGDTGDEAAVPTDEVTEAADDEGDDADAEVATAAAEPEPEPQGPPPLAPLPPLQDGLPPELTGRLLAAGPDGTLITIDWAEGIVEEDELIDREQTGSVSALELLGDAIVVLKGESGAVRIPDGSVLGLSDQLERLLPGSEAPMLVFRDGRTREVFLMELGPTRARGEPRRFGTDLELLWVFDDRVLAAKAGEVWLIDEAGDASLVTDGEVGGYDGRYLTMIRCDGPDRCRIEVGPPDDPARRSVPVPETLADRAVASWTSALQISADGRRLATVNGDGFSLPIWIDLDTGEDRGSVDSAVETSPLAWSPDGRFLVYAIDRDDLMLWDTDTDRRGRIALGRVVDRLLWIDDAVAADDAAEAAAAAG